MLHTWKVYIDKDIKDLATSCLNNDMHGKAAKHRCSVYPTRANGSQTAIPFFINAAR